MKTIYLAGPEVFFPNAVEIGELKKELCAKYGFKGVYPLDKNLEFSSTDKQYNGLIIAKANEETIIDADYVIANMTPFRGTSCDVGTAYEMGFAKALGKKVFAYSNDVRPFLQRNLEDLAGAKQIAPDSFVDGQGLQIENFDLTDNLMLNNALAAKIILHKASKDNFYQDLSGFEACLQQLKQLDN